MLHLVLATSYVQNRVLQEVKTVVNPLGIELNIESIEFALFSPRIYLNRVKLRTNLLAMIQIPKPLSIERIKISINPFPLFYGQLTLSEVALFQPKIVIEEADVIYKKGMKLIAGKEKWKVKGSRLNIEVQKIGVVDAYVLVTTVDPKLGIDSGRFTLFVEQSAKEQYSITSNFSNLTFDRGPLHTVIRAAELDCDITPRSLRANRIRIDSDFLTMDVKGATSLPIDLNRGPESFRAVYELRASLKLLNLIEEFKSRVPNNISGFVSTSGALEKNKASYLGSGKLSTENLFWNGYKLGNGELNFVADGKKASLSKLKLEVGAGFINSDKIGIDFKDRSPFIGELNLVNVEIHDLLAQLKLTKNPLYVALNGKVKAEGFLARPFSIQGEVDSDLDHLVTIAHVSEPITPGNTVISVEHGNLSSSFSIKGDEGNFKTQVKILDGVMIAYSQWRKGDPFKIDLDGKGLSLFKLGKIQDLSMGGLADLKGKITLDHKGEPVIAGSLELKNAEIGSVVLGPVKGTLFYQGDLLAFESLELPSLDTIKSSGFIDFKPKDTRYKFQISTKRGSVDQVFQFFKKSKLGFSPPKGGEVSANVVLEGGHDNKGIQVTASGSVRGIEWFQEKWLGGTFSMIYRDDYVEISRGTLTKPRGAVGFKGFFKGEGSHLTLQSYGLKLEDIDHIHGSPIAGEIVGQINLDGDLESPTGKGQLKLIKTAFRGQVLGDSSISIQETPERTEFSGNLFGNSLQGRVSSIKKGPHSKSEVLLTLNKCNITPLLSMWAGKELPSFGNIRATGEVELNGNLNRWESINGSGSFSDILLDLKTAPVRNQKPISFSFNNGAVKISPFELAGQDSLISGFLEFKEGETIKGSLDGKLDLIYLQPFIPGLEYGTGRVSAGLRVSGELPNYDLLGSVSLEEGTFRIQNLSEDFRGVRTQLSVTEDKIGIDRFESMHGGGSLQVKGDIKINRMTQFSPHLQLLAKGVGFRQENSLSLKVSGDLKLNGEAIPYLLSGNCHIDEGLISDFNISVPSASVESPVLKFDLHCRAEKGLLVDTEVMQAEWKGDFHLLGDTNKIGLLGTAESVKGSVFFKETKFNLLNGNIKFEDASKINPRFNVAANSFVREQRAQVPIEYEVNLSAYGVASDYKIRLSSVPTLSEPNLIALLVLGVTTRGQDDNYLDFGSTLVGKSPLQSKIQNELGVNIKVNMQRSGSVGPQLPAGTGGGNSATGSAPAESSVPAVKIQKDITKRTKVSYSSTLDQNAMKEFKIEQLLDDHLTVNASAVDKIRGNTQNDAIKSYGLDFRYRFQFE